MKLYIPPNALFDYWWRTRRAFDDVSTSACSRWQVFDGELPERNDRGVFFTACDAAYFDLYAENYVSSIAASRGGQSVHLHVYDGSDSQLACAEQLGRKRGISVTATRDREFDRSLYTEYLFAAGRFIVLGSLLRAAASPVICTDIDVLVRRSFDDFVASLFGHDASLHLRPDSSLPWRKVLASTVVAMPTLAGQRFFDVVGSTLAEILARPVGHHVDQIVLYLAYRRARSAGREHVRFAPMGKEFIDWDFGEQSLVWNAKGPQRKPAYWDAVRAGRACQPGHE